MSTYNGLFTRPVDDLAEEFYSDCQQQVFAPIFEGVTGQEEADLTDCPAWNRNTEHPLAPTTCTQAVCLSVASLCVAERLALLVPLIILELDGARCV